MIDRRSPIDRMIDAATGHNPNAPKPVPTTIEMRCPNCKRVAEAERGPWMPAGADWIKIQCPDCTMTKTPDDVIQIMDKDGNALPT